MDRGALPLERHAQPQVVLRDGADLGDQQVRPEAGREVAANAACAVVESVKAASDVYAPLPGRVVEANARLAEDPGLVNRDPTGEGWFYKLEVADAAALGELMDEAGYRRFVESQA